MVDCRPGGSELSQGKIEDAREFRVRFAERRNQPDSLIKIRQRLVEILFDAGDTTQEIHRRGFHLGVLGDAQHLRAALFVIHIVEIGGA